jgi:hypothetical protein
MAVQYIVKLDKFTPGCSVPMFGLVDPAKSGNS